MAKWELNQDGYMNGAYLQRNGQTVELTWMGGELDVNINDGYFAGTLSQCSTSIPADVLVRILEHQGYKILPPVK